VLPARPLHTLGSGYRSGNGVDMMSRAYSPNEPPLYSPQIIPEEGNEHEMRTEPTSRRIVLEQGMVRRARGGGQPHGWERGVRGLG
jgi:hypothetical protein